MRRSKKEVLQMNAVETAQEIASFMKENDYKKRGLGWKKHCNDVSLTVTMEKSLWDQDTWYLWFGVTVPQINDIDSFQAANYPIRTRLEGWKLTIDQIKYAVKLWEEKYGSVPKLARAAVENKIPRQSEISFIRHLTSGEYFNIAFYSEQ